MWRDRWFVVGVLGSLLACLACATPLGGLLLAAIGLAAWARSIDVVILPVVIAFVILALYRVTSGRRRSRP